MKCKSPIALFLQCLKSIWRIVFGRKRVASGEINHSQLAVNSNSPSVFTGVTVDSASSNHGGITTIADNNTWQDWNTDSSASTCPSFSPANAPSGGGVVGVPTSFSAADAWRQSMVQQKAQLPSPNPEEDTNFFDDMAPKVHKQKKISLRAKSDEAPTQITPSSRLAFNIAGPVNAGLSEWVDDETENNWDLEEVGPREVRKARKLAREHAFASEHHVS